MAVAVSLGGTARALLRSCHPAPCAAVTVFSTVLAALAGNSPARCAVLACAILSGQLSIGWSNDRIDAARDTATFRTDKPVAAGEVSTSTIDAAIVVALVAMVPLSFALGWRAGLLHCAAVGCGWLYNLELKATAISWLPYALAFGSLPAIATLALPQPRLPSAGIVIAAGALGVVANLTNALPDLRGDLQTGVRGLPHRLGATGSVLLSAALMLSSSIILVLTAPGGPTSAAWAGLAVVVTLVAIGTPWALKHPLSRAVFYGLIALVAVQLALLVVSAHQLR